MALGLPSSHRKHAVLGESRVTDLGTHQCCILATQGKIINVNHVPVTQCSVCINILESQMALRFALRPTMFKLLANFRQVYQMTHKITLKSTRSKIIHIIVLEVFLSSKPKRFLLAENSEAGKL